MKIQSLAQLITVRGPLSVLTVTNITTETMATVADILHVFTCADKHGLSFCKTELLSPLHCDTV